MKSKYTSYNVGGRIDRNIYLILAGRQSSSYIVNYYEWMNLMYFDQKKKWI